MIKIKKKLNDGNEIYGKIDCFIVVPEFVFNYFTVKISNTNGLNNIDNDNDNENDLYDYMEYKNQEVNDSKNKIESEGNNINSDANNLGNNNKFENNTSESNSIKKKIIKRKKTRIQNTSRLLLLILLI